MLNQVNIPQRKGINNDLNHGNFLSPQGSRQKKVLLLMAGQLRPNPPPLEPPLERSNVGKKGYKKSYFFLNYPTPLTARPLREELFLAASLNMTYFSDFTRKRLNLLCYTHRVNPLPLKDISVTLFVYLPFNPLKMVKLD